MPVNTIHIESEPIDSRIGAPVITDDDVNRILEAGDDVSRVMVMARDSNVEAQTLAEAINRQQERRAVRTRRWLLALLDTILPG